MNPFLRSAIEQVLVRAPRRTALNSRLVLAYHNIIPSGIAAAGDASLHLPVEMFDAQLRLLSREADIVPLKTLVDFAGGSARDRQVAVTFDDAYATAMTLGLPLCTAHGADATVFVAPGLLGTLPPWDRFAQRAEWSTERREKFLWQESGLFSHSADRAPDEAISHLQIATSAQLKAAIGGTSHVVGNHTFDHANLGALSTSDASMQIRRADLWLKEHFPSHVPELLSYPYGIPPRSPQLAVEGTSARFAFMVSGGWMGPRPPADLLSIPRWNVPSGISLDGFRLRLRGWLTT